MVWTIERFIYVRIRLFFIAAYAQSFGKNIIRPNFLGYQMQEYGFVL